MLNYNSSRKSLQPSEEASDKIIPTGLYRLTGLAMQNKPAKTRIVPKIVGKLKHYPPANKEWKNSIYAYNKNSLKSLASLDKIANKTIKSYFNLTNNKKLARSERMRNLIRRRTVKRLFVSKPEIKQTSDKVNITVYTFNREKQFLLRKMYFYNRNLNINKNIYLYKLWLKKNLLAFKRTFENRKSIKLIEGSKKIRGSKKIKTQRKNINKTYIHNILLKKYFLRGPSASAIGPISKQGIKKNKSFLKQVRIALLVRKLLVNKLQGIRGALPVNGLQRLPILIANNLLKSLKKRNLIRLLKKQDGKKITSSLKNYDLVANDNVKKTFKNYLTNKVSRKINFKLRNFNSIVKIKQRLKKSKRFRFKKIRLPYSNLKFRNEIKFFSFKLVSELKYIRKLFQFYFLKYVLYTLGISIRPDTTNISKDVSGNEKNSFYKYKAFTNSTENKDSLKEIKIIQFKNRYSYDKLKNLELLNLELLHFFKTVLSGRDKRSKPALDIVFNKRENLDFLYKKFENKYFLRFLAKFFKKEFLYINYYSKFLINQLKFGKFLPGLKHLVSRIYSKKVDLNIVNLKYSHLNSDIYTDSIATKLKRKLSLLRVLKGSLNLVKLPKEYLLNNNSANLNQLQTLNIYSSLDINSLGEKKKQSYPFEDRIHGVLDKLYPYSLAHSYSSFNSQAIGDESGEQLNNPNLNISLGQARSSFPNAEQLTNNSNFTIPNKNLSILNIIKYKWVSGVRLEAAGRLTRRYTAARSVFKFRYKGSLKDIDYSQNIDISKNRMSTVMLRNSVKSNSQYSFTKSKKRIGAFGLKAWIASY